MNALLVFAKLPLAGRVKTRLTPAITPEQAASLYRAFLADAALQYADLDCAIRYYVAPSGVTNDERQVLSDQTLDVETTRALIPMGADSTLHIQRGDGLGERMLNAFLDAFKSGYERIIVIGSDHPTLPMAFVSQAFAELEVSRTVVVGPASDGGYYLLGLNELYPTLFKNMRYSHGDVLEDTLERVAELDTRLVVLPEWTDVDTPAELISLYQSFWPLAGEEEQSGEADLQRRHAPNSAEELKRLAEQHDWIADIKRG